MKQDYVVGDHIVDSSCIYEITSVGEMADGKGTERACVHYKPIWGSDKVYTASIPIDNLKKAGTRKVFTPKEAGQIMDDLRGWVPKNEYNTITAKEEIYQNNPEGIISVLTYFWKSGEILNKSDRELMEQVLEHLCQEISFATKKKYANVREGVVEILNRQK